MSDYRFEFVKRHESHTGNEIDCLHVMIDSNSLKEIADTHIPLDDILEAATVQGYMTIASRIEPTPKHDGKLASHVNGDFDAKVWLDKYHARLECFGQHVVLEAQQALSLLDWLREQEATLAELAKEQGVIKLLARYIRDKGYQVRVMPGYLVISRTIEGEIVQLSWAIHSFDLQSEFEQGLQMVADRKCWEIDQAIAERYSCPIGGSTCG